MQQGVDSVMTYTSPDTQGGQISNLFLQPGNLAAT